MKVFIQNDAPHRAIELYESTSSRSCHNDLTHNLVIKACSKSLNLEKGREIHRNLENLGNIKNVQILNSLIHFYGVCGELESSLSIFRSISPSDRDIVTVNTMMLALMDNQRSECALTLYDDVNSSNLQIDDDRCHLLAIKASMNIPDFDRGLSIHRKLKERGKTMDIQLSTTLIDFYGEMKDIWSAMDIFNAIPQSERSIICNNAMMTALIHCEYHRDALTLFHSIRSSKRNATTLMLAVTACIHCNLHRDGIQIIESIHPQKLKDISLNSKVIEFYGHFGDIQSAKSVYNVIDGEDRNIIHETAMMNAFCVNGFHIESLQIFNAIPHHQRDSVLTAVAMRCHLKLHAFSQSLDLYRGSPRKDVSLHILAIKSCIGMDNLSEAVSIHQQIDEISMRNPHLVQVLIECYSRFGDIVTASNLFYEFIAVDFTNSEVVAAAMMRAFIDNQCPHHALDFYDEQIRNGMESMDKLHILALKTCANLHDEERGKRIHGDLGDAISNIAVRTSLIDMFGSFGDVESALNVFESLNDTEKNMVIVNAMMNVLYKNGRHSECMQMFRRYLGFEHLQHDVIYFTVIIASCIESGNVVDGMEVHEILKEDEGTRWILEHDEIATNLIHFYGKKGMMEEVEGIFYAENKDGDGRTGQMKSVSVWNAMIHCYGMNGDVEKAQNLFDQMHDDEKREFIAPKPDRKTYIHIINALSHCGDVSGAVKIWNERIERDDMKYDDFVLSALIDCMARNGHVHEGFEYITKYNVQNEVAWIALMSGCKSCNDHELAQRVMNEMINRFGDASVCVEASRNLFNESSSTAN